jgi:lipopolysaccharide transport system ATP-binding protein
MSDVILTVENLGKKYRIYHQEERRRYVMLRDVITQKLASPFRRLLAKGPKTNIGSPTSEDFWALKDVSFQVKRGDVVGIIGRNGAGKSTLLKVLSRITEPTEGRVRIQGRVASLLEVGTGFHPELTGRENVFLNGAILGMHRAEIKSKFDEIVAFAEVERFLDTPVKRYSSGMYVRLAFAVAAHLEPEILIVDEVLAVGDAQFQKKCLGKMHDVATGGRTVLFVSHNMAALENLCPHAILLESGRMTQSGPAAEVIRRYLATQTSLSLLSLANRNDRRGAGEIRVTAIETLDEKSQPTQYLASGKSAVFRVHYSCSTARVYPDCRVWIAVEKEGRPYIMLPTDVVDQRRLDLQGSGYLDYTVPDLPLSAGEYVIDYYIDSEKVIQDTLFSACPLSVVDGNYYGSGRDYPDGWAGRYLLVKFDWQLGRRGAAARTELQMKP